MRPRHFELLLRSLRAVFGAREFRARDVANAVLGASWPEDADTEPQVASSIAADIKSALFSCAPRTGRGAIGGPRSRRWPVALD
ncbi:MAG: hypothetical protein U1F67_10380 [Rubrivivax sp.]